ncbi:MAG: HTH domain-containing protein [bacterium]
MQVMQELKRRQKTILKEFKAREKKGKRLLRKIAAHEKILETFKNELSALFDQSGAAPAPVENQGLLRRPAKAHRAAARLEHTPQRERVKTVLEKTGRSMSIPEIVGALQADGYTFRSKNPAAALTVMMYTHKHLFKKVAPGRFEVVRSDGYSSASGSPSD